MRLRLLNLLAARLGPRFEGLVLSEEVMAVVVPFLVHKCPEALKSSIVRIEENLRQGAKNRGALVATRTVNQAVGAAGHNRISDLVTQCQDLLDL